MVEEALRGYRWQGKLPREAQVLVAAPERSVHSIKRQMGSEGTVAMAEKPYRPQEISVLILRTPKQRAEQTLGEPVEQAVITVPAYVTDAHRQATKEAGEIAGLEVLQILNEPTAAARVFDRLDDYSQRLLVNDLGGGTFDVSIVDVTPHSLGVAREMKTEQRLIPNIFSTILPRNTVIPATPPGPMT